MSNSEDSERKPIRTHVQDFLCGVGSWRPRWLQTFASPHSLFVFFNFLGISQGAYKSYTVGTLSTLERRFGLSTGSIAVILVAESISPVFLDVFTGYVAGWMSRPKMLSLGMMVVSASSILVTLPYAMYGPATTLLAKGVDGFEDAGKMEFCGSRPPDLPCSASDPTGVTTSLPFAILFVASFMNGIGQSVLHVAGSSYMDDSIKKKNSPMYFGASYSVRAIGPALGFLGAGLCLSLYEDPFYEPDIDPADPRWIGCWWLGYLVCGCVMALASLPVLLFPKVMPSRLADPPQANKKGVKSTHLKEIAKSVRRLLGRRVYVLQVLASIFMVSGFNGFSTFSAKYMETQFRTSASKASTFAGLVSTSFFIVSFFVSGWVIHRTRPTPRVIGSYNVTVKVLLIAGFLVAMFIKCDFGLMPGVTVSKDGLDLVNSCNRGCDCTSRAYQPVCEQIGGTLYFSPCFAGCPRPTQEDTSNLTKLENCRCLKLVEDGEFFSGSVFSGFCKSTCVMFVQYVIIVSLAQFVGASASVGNTLIMLRSVSPSDKSMALGFANAMANLLAYIPFPLLYGAAMDGSCLVWESKCETRGNCWLYDLDKLRYSYFGTSITFLSLAVVFATGVACVASDIRDFYDDGYQEVYSSEDPKIRYKKRDPVRIFEEHDQGRFKV
ncbi:solute carrier organic anion transporter family member 74D [Ixodes scapularis]|uniref:solute carrier organic anion transporter family member 74D n=1 Tax=Ixodes scapularis TaxID=6945 RepID=UPI001AA0059A|nr:solute carrier organic anion transporter family member 74D [Ixodes scapularis]